MIKCPRQVCLLLTFLKLDFILDLFWIGFKPWQQNTTLPQEHGKCCDADNRPDESSSNGTGINYLWHSMHSCGICKIQKYIPHILLLFVFAMIHGIRWYSSQMVLTDRKLWRIVEIPWLTLPSGDLKEGIKWWLGSLHKNITSFSD